MILAGEVRAEAQVRRLTRRAKPRRRSAANVEGRGEVLRALADIEAACAQLDVVVHGVCRRHDPMGCLPVVLALATGAIVAGVTARSVRWYLAILLSFAGAAVMWLLLMFFRWASWSRHHPLLARMYKLQYTKGDGDDADDDQLMLGEAIVQHYLPPEQSEPLLARVDEAKQRVERLLGLEDDEPPPRNHAGA